MLFNKKPLIKEDKTIFVQKTTSTINSNNLKKVLSKTLVLITTNSIITQLITGIKTIPIHKSKTIITSKQILAIKVIVITKVIENYHTTIPKEEEVDFKITDAVLIFRKKYN